MIMFSKRTRPVLMLLAGAFVATQFAAVSAEARDGRQRQGHSRPHGDYTHQSQVQRTTSGYTRNDTWTSAQGPTASRDAVVVNDRQARTRTRDVQWQGPEGGQGSRHDVTQRTDDGYTRSATATGFDGGTRTVDDDLQRTDDGYSRPTTFTQPDGDVSSRNVTATYDSTNEVWSKDVSVQRANGD